MNFDSNFLMGHMVQGSLDKSAQHPRPLAYLQTQTCFRSFLLPLFPLNPIRRSDYANIPNIKEFVGSTDSQPLLHLIHNGSNPQYLTLYPRFLSSPIFIPYLTMPCGLFLL